MAGQVEFVELVMKKYQTLKQEIYDLDAFLQSNKACMKQYGISISKHRIGTRLQRSDWRKSIGCTHN